MIPWIGWDKHRDAEETSEVLLPFINRSNDWAQSAS